MRNEERFVTSFEMELELAESHDIRLAFGPVSALWRHSRQLVMYLGRVESCCGGFKVISDVVCSLPAQACSSREDVT